MISYNIKNDQVDIVVDMKYYDNYYEAIEHVKQRMPELTREITHAILDEYLLGSCNQCINENNKG